MQRKVPLKEVSVNAAVAAVSSELDNISSLKEEQKTKRKAFPDGNDVFTLPTGFSKSLN